MDWQINGSIVLVLLDEGSFVEEVMMILFTSIASYATETKQRVLYTLHELLKNMVCRLS